MENLLENLLEIFRYRSRFSLLIMPCVCYTWGVLIIHTSSPSQDVFTLLHEWLPASSAVEMYEKSLQCSSRTLVLLVRLRKRDFLIMNRVPRWVRLMSAWARATTRG
jgi:hypothetical protein